MNDDEIQEIFMERWLKMEQFFSPHLSGDEWKIPVLKFLQDLRELGYDKKLRAGQSLYNFIVSRSIHHGLKKEQPRIRFIFNRKGGMSIRCWIKGETITFEQDSIELTPQLQDLLDKLVEEPISDFTYKPYSCNCFNMYRYQEPTEIKFHSEMQDVKCNGWKRLLDLIEEAAEDEREEFAPFQEMTDEELFQIVTLPPTISKLKSVKRLRLWRSIMVRIPPEIGEMTNLEEFDPYTSRALHWYPFEITWCKNLKDSRVSTRALYGNFKHRPPFPRLQPDMNSTESLHLNNLPPEIWGTNSITTCSVCNRPLANLGLHQRWISLSVATDVLPLLVNACSETCIQKLPVPPDNYIQQPHAGGSHIEQPSPD